jgi:general secretion pathway protein K
VRGEPAISIRDRRRDGGFALILVLWTLVLVAFITAHLVSSGRTEVRIAGNIAANAMAEAAAEGATYQAIFNLMNPQPEARWTLDGTAHEFAIGNCRVTAVVNDEAGRINPNLAPPALMEALLQASGSDAATARRLAGSIGDWVGAPAIPRTPDALDAEYRQAGLDYAPPGEPVETIDELERVIGMTPEIFAAIRPHLSPFAPLQPVLAHADPVVAAAMAQIGAAQTNARTPPANVLNARIEVSAICPNGARLRQTAVARVVPASRSYAVLAWRRETE